MLSSIRYRRFGLGGSPGFANLAQNELHVFFAGQTPQQGYARQRLQLLGGHPQGLEALAVGAKFFEDVVLVHLSFALTVRELWVSSFVERRHFFWASLAHN
jgi:hypothetical protein